jgi:hypothetical protein
VMMLKCSDMKKKNKKAIVCPCDLFLSFTRFFSRQIWPWSYLRRSSRAASLRPVLRFDACRSLDFFFFSSGLALV